MDALRIGASRRRVTADWSSLVSSRESNEARGVVQVVEPSVDGVDLCRWGREAAALMDEMLPRRGAVLFRGFGMNTPERLETFIRTTSGDPVDYRNRSTPRSRVAGNIFTSTEYPPDQTIPMHNEMSYTRCWPAKVFFACVTPAAAGGETPLADSRRVYESIPADVRERFEAAGVMYVRHFTEAVDMSWREAFQTDDRADVERQCADAGIAFSWVGDRLTTRQTCQAVSEHPRTGEKVWFNQAHLFHVSSLPESARRALLESFGEDRLPRHAYYGDGSPIGDEELCEIRKAYGAHTVTFAWQAGDLLAVDNILIAHGRRPFAGARRVLVGMSEVSNP